MLISLVKSLSCADNNKDNSELSTVENTVVSILIIIDYNLLKKYARFHFKPILSKGFIIHGFFSQKKTMLYSCEGMCELHLQCYKLLQTDLCT